MYRTIGEKKKMEKRIELELKDENARIHFAIDEYRPNGGCTFGEIDNSDILGGSFGFTLYESDEWGVGEFSIRTDSVHRIAEQLYSFIHTDQPEVHIDEELRIDIVKDKGEFDLSFSMNDQLTSDYITVQKRLSYRDLFRTVLRPFYTMSEAVNHK